MGLLRFLYVQTKRQIYLYDCDNLLHNQQAAYVPIPMQQKGCQFLRKILPSNANREISNFKSVKNTIIIYYENGAADVLYTKDLINYFVNPNKYSIPRELQHIESLAPSDSTFAVMG